MGKPKSLQELIWNTIQAFIQNNPKIHNEDKLEEVLLGLEIEIANDLITHLKKEEKNGQKNRIIR